MKNPQLVAIVAMAPNRIIGNLGALPWHLPEDLKFFKQTTQGHPIVMGRKTFDSIGKPLPNRRNIVLTRDPSWSHPNVEIIHSPRELENLPNLSNHDTIFIIGGAEIYQAFASQLDALIVSHVHQTYPGDTQFPDILAHFPHQTELATFPDFSVKRYAKIP